MAESISPASAWNALDKLLVSAEVTSVEFGRLGMGRWECRVRRRVPVHVTVGVGATAALALSDALALHEDQRSD